ncbi:MAG: zinc ABC transporter substrate-binding protein [Burkholderiales bacterium]|nr:zinc ABC transporter substrate-binding protein [Burkholderiales bacterium]
MRRSHLRQLLAACALLALPQVASAQAAPPPLRVVATFSVLADMVREVGGPAVEVASLVGPNADAHMFAPTPADARRVASADLVVVNGLNYEGWIERLIRASGYKGPVLVASEGITPRRVGRGIDPHAWQSLAHAKQYVENIRAALVAAAPTRRAEIDTRAAAYLQRITVLEQDTLARIGRLPAQQRRVITAHDAFGYFAAAYGVEFVSPRGWSTDSEPSADAVARIVRQARAQQVGALLLENISDPRLIERIAREAGVGVGGALYSDALSPPGTAADTFLRMFAHNVRTIVEALEQARPAAFAKP